MVMQYALALTSMLAMRLRGERSDPIPHEALEHSHWDPARRVWFTHEDAAEVAPAKAA